MGDDLEIKDGEEQEPEVMYIESTTDAEYIQCAYFALAALEDVDTGIMNQEEKKRVSRIKRKSLKIIDKCIGDLYDECFEKDEENE